MMELALVNVALLGILCALPRRSGAGRQAGRRNAKAFLRSKRPGRRTLGALLLAAGRRAGRALWPVFEPQLLFPAQPSRVARAALVLPALGLALLALGGPAAIGDAPMADADARACSPTHDQAGGRMTTSPELDRLTTPAGAGFLTEI